MHHIRILPLAMATYGEHREFLEFSIDQHAKLMEMCAEWKIGYMTSVWDITAAQQIAELKPARIKIPSACNTDHVMLQWLFEYFSGKST